LLGEQRVAEVCILDQQWPADEPVRTTVRFQEFRQNGQPLSPLVVTLPGEEIYVDAFVTLFESDVVKSGQAKSVYLFRRIFTEQMAPHVGFPLYRSEGSGDGIPQSYVRQDMTAPPNSVYGAIYGASSRMRPMPKHSASAQRSARPSMPRCRPVNVTC
jgi:hypothetical protein